MKILLLLLAVSALAACSGLKAQPNNDDFDLVKGYQLPETAVPLSDVQEVVVLPQGATQADMRDAPRYMKYENKLFTGTTYERYDNGKLARVQNFKDGILDGPSYVWYPNGVPQMYVNYRHGQLNGRFLGWYMHGGILYDMVINNSGYAGDFIDDDRSMDSGETEEGEGDARVNEGD
ncbi:MAG TPA: hypothetical protein PKI15_07950 [Candidatus Cloacimonadota bacterium]|nr:hypothetical protein [Candidatus Cloacimonadota bacterium]